MKKITKITIIIMVVFAVMAGCDIPSKFNPDSSMLNGESGAKEPIVIHTNQVGFDQDGMFYSFWSDAGGATMTLNGGGNYETDWSNTGNIVCGKGWASGTEDRIVTYSASEFNGTYLCLYGWMTNPGNTNRPVIEYYIVETYGNLTPPGSGDGTVDNAANTVTDAGATYTLHRTRRNGKPWAVDGGTGNFYQYWSIRQGGRMSGTIDLSKHFQGWDDAGWTVGDMSAYYQIMATEGFGTTGNSNVTVSDDNESGIPDLVNKTFWGDGEMDPETTDTGDNRGGYTTSGFNAVFDTYFPELPIEFRFGTQSGNTIWTEIDITLAAFMTSPFPPYDQYIRLIPYPYAYVGWADIVDGKVVMNKNTADTVADFLDKFEITVEDPDTVGFYYEFEGTNSYIGYGGATTDGSINPSTFSRALTGLQSKALTTSEFEDLLEDLKPDNVPITWVPDIGWGDYYGTISPDNSAFNVKSGPWNGYLQIDFQNPYTYAEQPVKMILIDENGHHEVYDFADPYGTNPYYYTWGANIPLPSPNTRYRVVFINYMGTNVDFKARVW